MENQFYQMYLDELSEIPECTNEEMEALLNSLPNEEAVKRLTEGSLAYVVREAATTEIYTLSLHDVFRSVRQRSMQEMMLKYQILFRKETWHFCLY